MSLRGCRPKLSLRLDLFEEEYCLDLFGFLIALPFLDRFRYDPAEIMDSWGVYYSDAAVVLCWGQRCKFIHLPWQYCHIRTDVLKPDGTWVKEVPSYGHGEPDGRWQDSYRYRYVLRSGEVQERMAAVYVDRMEWRRKWLKWCPLFAKVRQSINVTFDAEVGEEAGSWKGGCVGCGYTMLDGETPLQTLRRMERERDF